MLQTLFHIPHEVGGIPLFGYGLLFVIWALASALFLAIRVHRHGFDAETRGYLPILLVIGAAIVFIIPAVMAPAGLPIRGYGTMLVLSIVAAASLAAYRAKNAGVHPEVILSLAFWGFVGGIIGARAFYVIEYWPEFRGSTMRETAVAIINLTQGGLVVYGAMVTGTASIILFLVKNRLPVLAIGDIVAPSVALGLGLGRLGCFMNGCCFGGECDLPWAVRFPAPSPPFQRQVERGEIYLHGFKFSSDRGSAPVVQAVEPGSLADRQGLARGDRITSVDGRPVRNVAEAEELLLQTSPGSALRLIVAAKGEIAWNLSSEVERARPLHPTQLYSAIDGVVLCGFLLAVYPFRRRDGETLAWLLTLHPISRFLLEMVRVDEPGVFGTQLSIAQVISLVLLVCAAALWSYLRILPRGTVLPARWASTG